MMMIHFWVLYFYETFICFREVLNLNCCIGKKMQKNILMDLKFGEVGGLEKKTKFKQVGRFFEK